MEINWKDKDSVINLIQKDIQSIITKNIEWIFKSLDLNEKDFKNKEQGIKIDEIKYIGNDDKIKLNYYLSTKLSENKINKDNDLLILSNELEQIDDVLINIVINYINNVKSTIEVDFIKQTFNFNSNEI